MVLGLNAGMMAGADYLWVGRRDTNGYFKGAADTVALKTVYGAHLHGGGYIEAAAPAIQEAIARQVSGNKLQAQINFGTRGFDQFELVLGAWDPTFVEITSGIDADNVTHEGWIRSGLNTGQQQLPNCYLALGSQFQELGGSAMYRTLIWQNAQIRVAIPGSNQNDGDNPNPVTASATPTPSTRDITGIALAADDDWELVATIISANPIHVVRWTADGTDTSFKLPYLPAFNTANGEDHNRITKNGATQTVTSVNTSTGVVTLSAAGTSGDVYIVVYEVTPNWTPSP